MDPVSQILCEVKEIRRSYSTLAGSLLIIRRNQEDIKNRLTEIGLSVSPSTVVVQCFPQDLKEGGG